MSVKLFVFILVVVLFAKREVLCKRGGSGGRQRTTARTTPRTYHQQTTPYQQNNAYPVHQNNPPAIGFDNVNRQSSSNSHPIGFENVQNRPPQVGNPPPTNIGFNNHPPQVPQQTHGYNPYAQQPPTWNQPTVGYNNPHYTGYQSHSGYNPYLSQPGSYYNNFASPGVQPQLYQPQQSSGFGAGSLLGIAGGFGGGYLLGRLTSGGHDSKESENKNQPQFIVNHYYNNAQGIPKEITVSNGSLVTCMENVTKSLCVPNTFPMCLSNRTIMCVTHTRFTVPCTTNTTMMCIVTALPCNNKEKNCNAALNLSNTAVFVPCISNVTITGQNDTSVAGNNELCITAMATPAKKLESPVPSLVNLMSVIAMLPLELQSMNVTTLNYNATSASESKTEMPPTKVRDS